MSNEKDFDIDALLQVEPPATSTELALENDSPKSVESESVVASENVQKKTEKKSLFNFGSKKEGAKKEESIKPKETVKATSQKSGKNKIMLLVLIAVTAVMGGAIVMQKMKSNTLSSSPFPQVTPPQATPVIVKSVEQQNINPMPQNAPALPPGLQKAENTEAPIDGQLSHDKQIETPSSTNSPSTVTAESSKEGTLPKIEGSTAVSGEKVVTTDQVIAEQKAALNNILKAAESNAKPIEDSKVAIADKKQESIKVESKEVIKSSTETNKVPDVSTSKPINDNVLDKVKQMEIVELSSKYLKIMAPTGRIVTYEVGDLLPGNAKILRIDVHREKVYTNKGNIVIQ